MEKSLQMNTLFFLRITALERLSAIKRKTQENWIHFQNANRNPTYGVGYTYTPTRDITKAIEKYREIIRFLQNLFPRREYSVMHVVFIMLKCYITALYNLYPLLKSPLFKLLFLDKWKLRPLTYFFRSCCHLLLNSRYFNGSTSCRIQRREKLPCSSWVKSEKVYQIWRQCYGTVSALPLLCCKKSSTFTHRSIRPH